MQVGSLLIYGNAVQTATTSFTVAKGTAAQRPTAVAGMLRFNTDTNRFEATTGATPAWASVGLGDGSVSSITLATASTGLSITNPTVTTSGTINITLAGEIAALNALSTTGLIARTGTATYAPRSITASAAAAQQGIALTNGDGVAGAPTVGLALSTLTAAGSVATTDQFVIYNGTNNVRATVSQVLANVSGFTKAARTAFTNATLSSGILTFTHSLGQQFVNIAVFDNNNKQIQPDDITATSASVSTIDLSSFGTLTGTWNIVANG
ncbi:MAG: hypothetical protein EOO77_10735 [Oxalobacteraceae bacterium]|nr:MAG: hypothetical protein EOO77_10735 [Oxalobacteraceae bacterium]